MKSDLLTGTSFGSTTTVKTQFKVCMHMLRKAHKDVRAMRTASTLIKEGFTVTIVDVETESLQSFEEDINGIRLRHMLVSDWYSSRRLELWFFFKVIRTFILSILLLMRTQADIYHACELTALPACYIVAKLRRKPLIFEAYELHLPVPETSISFWRLVGGLLMRLLAIILPQCAGVVTTSPLHAQEFRNRYHVSEISLIRSVPPYQAVVKSDRLRHHLGLSENVHIALYQGNFLPNRELDRLIRAASFLESNTVIVMMGNGTPEYQEQLEALIISEGVADRVKIIPAVPYLELLDWTASADIGLIIYSRDYSLNIQKCLPNKLFEFLMAGLPVLTSQLDAIVELVKTKNVGEVVSSIDPKDIAIAINTMLEDEESLAYMKRNALDIARQEFNWEKECHYLISLYTRILVEEQSSFKKKYRGAK